MIRKAIGLAALSGAIIAAGFGVGRGLRAAVNAFAQASEANVPTSTVRRTDVAIEVSAREH
jgi:hypothetical protein